MSDARSSFAQCRIVGQQSAHFIEIDPAEMQKCVPFFGSAKN
jgi:hypothetical protein